MTPEGRVKEIIKARLDHIGAWYFLPVAGFMGRIGIPDFVGCYRGRFFGIEAKAEGGRLTRIQQACLGKIKAAGGTALVVTGKGEADALTGDMLCP